MELLQSKKKAVIVNMWDSRHYFDSEVLIDCLGELYKCNIKGKLYRLIYKLNQNIRIQVKTAVGLSDSEDTGEGVGQGTSDGAVISAVNLDKGVEEEFDDVTLVDSDGERNKLSDIVNVYEDSFHTVIFQDDLFKMSEDREAAQRANDKMNNLVESKCLSFNYGKCVCMVLGDKKRGKSS